MDEEDEELLSSDFEVLFFEVSSVSARLFSSDTDFSGVLSSVFAEVFPLDDAFSAVEVLSDFEVPDAPSDAETFVEFFPADSLPAEET